MKLHTIALIGFLAFTLCPSLCPENLETASMDSSMDHSMHAMHTDDSASPCEHCELQSVDDLAFTNSTPEVQSAAVAWLVMNTNMLSSLEYEETGDPVSDLASAGPPITPSLVSTIVLRT